MSAHLVVYIADPCVAWLIRGAMHEISLCESIRSIVEDAAASQGFSRVKRIRLEIGALACVEPEALRFGFSAVMPGSPAEDAELEIINLPGRAWCFDCSKEIHVHSRLDLCAECGGARLTTTSGEEMRIKDMEVQ